MARTTTTLIRAMCAAVLAAALSTLSVAGEARAEAVSTHDGLVLLHMLNKGRSVPTPRGLRSDQVFKRMRAALDVLKQESARSYRQINSLRGLVVVAYDPYHRSTEYAILTLASFRERTDVPELDVAPGRKYVAILGPHVITWPPRELAAIIVHELVGHGLQFQQGRLHTMREVDRECEARLYQLRAQQDFGVGSTSARTVKFRRTLEDLWCSNFKKFLWNIDPNTLSL